MPKEDTYDAFRESLGLPPIIGTKGPAQGVFGVLEYLSRPAFALSEATQAVGAGEGFAGGYEGLKRGLSGERKFPTLGETLFKGAEDEEFTSEDIGAFAVDFVADPLLAVGAGFRVAKYALKYPAKGILAIGKKFLPETKKILSAFPELEYLPKELGGLRGNVAAKAKLLTEDLEALNLSPTEALRRVVATVPDVALPKTLQQAHMMRGRDKFAKATLKKGLQGLSEETIDMMRAGVRSIEANFQPIGGSRWLQDMATRWAPARVALENFGGQSGKTLARNYDDVMQQVRLRESEVLSRLEAIVKGISTDDLTMAVKVREGRAVAPTAKVDQIANDLGKLLDDHFDDLTGYVGPNLPLDPVHLDPFQRMIQVLDRATGEKTDLINHRIQGYFPHQLPDKYFGNPKKLTDHLLAQGMSARQVTKFVNRMQWKPKMAGAIELKRTKDLDLLYEMDPRVALPRYFRDTIMRQEMAKKFGINHEILDNLAGDLKRTGLRPTWVDDLTGAMAGENKKYDQGLMQFASAINSVQAVTKLGFATSVANFSQGPLNQVIRSGWLNYAKSLGKFALGGTKNDGVERIGMAAYNRGMQEQIQKMIHGTGGGLSQKISSAYMKGIGFNASERIGRHIGAIGGEMEVRNFINQWQKYTKGGEVGKAKKIVEELTRKYGISGDELRRSINFPDVVDELVEVGALKASDAVMHAFDVMDLPLGWRDPMWRVILQFKSFGYKQLEFMGREVMQPALQYLASGGTKGNIGPMMRAGMMYPPMAVFVDSMRDVVKNIPDAILWGEWDLKDPYWKDPHPYARLWNDMMYIGSLGLMGDLIEQAERGKVSNWILGPSAGEAIRGAEEVFGGRFRPGKAATRLLPGALSPNRARSILDQAKSGADLPFEWMLK
jgi:hypothetical protein